METHRTAQPLTIVLAPTDEEAADRRASLAAAVATAPVGVDLVVLPYLGAIPYVPAACDRTGYRHAERWPYPTVERVAAAAGEWRLAVAVSYFEVVGEGVFYSTLALVGADGGTVGSYRQAHALNRVGQHEQLFFQPGTSQGPPVFGLGGRRIGFLLGGDLWVPEAARLLALGGAEVLIAVGAVRAGEGDVALALARARAGTGLEAVAVGFDPAGSPLGVEVASGGAVLVSLDLTAYAEQRRRDDPLRPRRPELYRPLASGEADAR